MAAKDNIGPQFDRYGEPLNLPVHQKNIPAYIEYPPSSGLGDDEGFVSEYELGTAQFKGSSNQGGSHVFLLHDGRYAHVDVAHYTPTKRNMATQGHDFDEPWVAHSWVEEKIVDDIINNVDKPPRDDE